MKEPLFHIIRKNNTPAWTAWLIRLAAILIAFALVGVLTVFLTGLNPIDVYVKLFQGCFKSSRKVWKLLQGTAILLCIALALTPAFKMRFWNTGGEGQVLVGGLVSAIMMMFLADKLPNYVLIPCMLIAAMLAGAIWGVIPAIFKAKWNTNETLFTLMMNYVAIQLVSYFCIQFANPKGSGHIGVLNQKTEIGWLPKLFGQNYLFNILIVVAILIFIFVYLKYSKHGYELSVVGESERTAKYIGINVKKVIIRTMVLSGAICGIAGFLLVSGTDHTISTETAGGQGFTAIMVSWLAKFNPIAMVFAAFLIIFMKQGADEITTAFQLNHAYADILSGIIIFFIIGCEFFINYRIIFRNQKKKMDTKEVDLK